MGAIQLSKKRTVFSRSCLSDHRNDVIITDQMTSYLRNTGFLEIGFTDLPVM